MIRILFWLIIFGRAQAWKARRQHRTGWFLVFTALAALGDVLLTLLTLGVVALFLAAGEPIWSAVFGVTCAVLFIPHVLIDRVAVPLGWYRAAHVLAWFDHLGRAHADRMARLAAARALARRGAPADGVAWLRTQTTRWVTAIDITGEAVLAQARGDLADARALFESLALVGDPAPEARELASEWLALDDARAGRWAAILARAGALASPVRGGHRSPAAIRGEAIGDAGGGEPLWPATATTFFLEAVAARLLRRPDAPAPLGLWVRWLEAPHRRRTWPLLQRALRATRGAPGATATPGAAAVVDPAAAPLANAVRAHAAAVALATAGPIVAAARAWDGVLDDASWRTDVLGRAAALGAPSDAGTRAVAELREQVVGDLAAVIVEAAIELPALAAAGEGSAVLAAAIARGRHELLGRLELSVERLGARVVDQQALPAVDEWRSFLAVYAEYAALARQGGLELERLAYPHVHAELTSWTVWLWNQRKEYTLSHAITAWLFERALAVGDAEAIELHGKNGAIAAPDA